MRGYFDYIFLGKGGWCFEKGDQHLVDDLIAIANRAQMDGMRGLLLQIFAVKNVVANTDCLFSGDADHGNGANPLRSG